MTSFVAKLRHIYSVPYRALAACFESWAILMPAKSHLDDEYTFPEARWAGQGRG